MYVCLCAKVTDRQVVRLARHGCRDVAAVAARCGAGAYCGGCRNEVRRLIGEATGRPVEPEDEDEEPRRAG